MKIALIGNMNNNNFAIMRYFRDLGVDAHLLLYSNDGENTLSHFKPECDTWQIDKWQPYIHRLSIENGIISGAAAGWAWLLYLKNVFDYVVNGGAEFPEPVTKNSIKAELDGYDFYIGTGIAPALFLKSDLTLNVFVPYGCGIEYVVQHYSEKKSLKNYLIERMYQSVRRNQIEGLKSVKMCFNAEMGVTADAFNQLGIKFIPLAMPMVYNNEQPQENLDGIVLREDLARIAQSGFSIISHGRQYWKNPGCYPADIWEGRSKHNEWLLFAFAKLCQERAESNPLLVLVEYGEDVGNSKLLCEQLEISDHVLWLPIMDRKLLLQIIGVCDVGVGEFYTDHGTIWGGTGWEIFSAGKPLIQGFIFNEGEFEDKFGHPPPPLLSVTKQDDVFDHLLDAVDNQQLMQSIGEQSKEWFNQYNGVGLAKKWLELLTTE